MANNVSQGKELILSEYVLEPNPLTKSYHGQVHSVRRITDGQVFVVKIEDTTRYQLLKNEYEILKALEGFRGIPRVIRFSEEANTNKARNLMVMEMLGDNLEAIFKKCNRKFSNKCVVQLALQMLNLVESVHEKSYVHCDIIPENFCVANPRQAPSILNSFNDGFGNNLIYLVDYGLSYAYMNKQGLHVKDEGPKPKRATLSRYMSRNVHKGKKPTRRDDLESLGYIWAYFLVGEKGLKWQNDNRTPVAAQKVKSTLSVTEVPVSNNDLPEKAKASQLETSKEILKIKETVSYGMLFEKVPILAEYMKHVCGLKFEEKPNYLFLRETITKAYEQFKCDNIYDWQPS